MQTPTTLDSAFARQVPDVVAIALARDAQGRVNPITLAWFMRVSIEPPMLAIAIGLERYSLDALRTSRAFVLALPGETMTADVVFHGTKSGRDLDKLAACNTRTQPATAISGLLLADAVANFECRVVGEFPAGDHIIFTGEIVAAHVNTDPQVRRLFSLGNKNFGPLNPA